MMTVVVTRSVPERFRGFLASVMCEVAPGVYTGPRMAAGVRERVWKVMTEWFEGAEGEGVLMTWPDAKAPGGQVFLTLGSPRVDLYEIDEMVLVRAELTAESRRSMKSQQYGS